MKTTLLLEMMIGLSSLVGHGLAFILPAIPMQRDVARDIASASLMAQVQVEPTGTSNDDLMYPVISRIAGKNWTGTCKYIDADLIHLSKLKLIGGVRYDIEGRNVKLSSYLTFPDGKTREVVMEGSRDAFSHVITLNPIEEGPIRMLLSEVGADTILVNEIEAATGRTIMTCSTSITQGGMELVQVSHEVGDDGIEGHQVWRLTENKNVPRKEDSVFDAGFRSATGQ